MSDEIEVVDPATGEVIGTIPAGGPAEADRAVSRARRAQEEWERAGAAARAASVKAAARVLRENVDELAELQTRENGKPLEQSRGGVLAGINTLEQYAELGPLHRGHVLNGEWGAFDSMVRAPRGVVAAMTPWNDPLAIACQCIGAAVVVGNTIVFKPSEKTPLSAVRLHALLQRELPEGVVELALGDGRLGQALVEHPDVDAVLHVGSIRTGQTIAAACARTLKKAILELGGKDACIVDAGVDPDVAAEQVASGAFANAGQICVAVERVYVHRDVADAFLQALVKRAEALVVGPGLDPTSEVGPLIDAAQRDHVHAQVTDAVDRGARLLTGGTLPDGPGFFYPPTVLAEVTAEMAIMRDETFGPTAPVEVFDHFEEALELANATEYGLAASVLTPSQHHAQLAARTLRVGTVKINHVWGGAPGGAAHPHKRSGQGFGYGPELLDELTLTRVVHYRPL